MKKKTLALFLAIAVISCFTRIVALAPTPAQAVVSGVPEGALIRGIGQFDVWIVKYVGTKQFKRLILNPDVFNMYGHLRWEDIMDIDPAIVASFTESTLIRADGDTKVYKLYPDGDVGIKKWIQTGNIFTAWGYDWDAVYTINTFDRDAYAGTTPLAETPTTEEEEEEETPISGAPNTPSLISPGASFEAGASFSMNWGADSTAIIYVLERDTNSSFTNPTTIYSGANTTYAQNLSPTSNTTYYYRAQARNNIGSSSWSNTLIVSITVAAEDPSPTAPNTPVISDPGGNVASGANFTVSWGVATGATSYALQRDDNSLFTSPASVYNGSGASYVDNIDSAATKTYYYRVKATNAQGDSGWSSTVNIIINGVVSMVMNVPDTNQPPRNLLNTPSVSNFCTPISAANITEYWDNIAGSAHATDVNANFGASDASEYIAFFMNTNLNGSLDRAPVMPNGTSIQHIATGLIEWTVWDGNLDTDYGFDTPNHVIVKPSYTSWDVSTEAMGLTPLPLAWINYKSEIDAGRPVLMSFIYWNPVDTGVDLEDISFYTWGGSIENATFAANAPSDIEESWNFNPEDPFYMVGHSVTAVGYISSYDPGDGGGARDWVVVHDNWSTTSEDVAIPWNDSWMASTYVEPKANAVPDAPVLSDPGDTILSGNNFIVAWDSMQGANAYCYEWATNSSFNNSTGVCVAGATTLINTNKITDAVQTYYYRVKAQNNSGVSSWSNVESIMVTSGALVKVPQTHATIQAAVNAAVSGNVVYVSSGTYTGSITMKAGVKLVGTDANEVTIDANDDWIGITMDDNNLVQGFTITNAKTAMIRCEDDSNAVIRNNLLIAEADSSYNPAGIHVLTSSATITNNTIHTPGGGDSGIVTDTSAQNNLAAMNNIIINFTQGIFVQGGSVATSYNNVKGPYADRDWYGSAAQGVGEISQDALFVNSGSGDYSLQIGSPSKNTGNLNAIYNDNDGTRNDMGVYGGPSA